MHVCTCVYVCMCVCVCVCVCVCACVFIMVRNSQVGMASLGTANKALKLSKAMGLTMEPGERKQTKDIEIPCSRFKNYKKKRVQSYKKKVAQLWRSTLKSGIGWLPVSKLYFNPLCRRLKHLDFPCCANYCKHLQRVTFKLSEQSSLLNLQLVKLSQNKAASFSVQFKTDWGLIQWVQ